MKKIVSTIAVFGALMLPIIFAAPAYAQASRTWVSGVGDDANPCSRTAPCKTFAGAISKTANGGEIDALDPGGFGGVTITKSITLDGGGGQVASVLVSGTPGITVAAQATDTVTIRNLRINGIFFNGVGGTNGIRFSSGANLHIENTTIFGFSGICVDSESSTVSANLFMKNDVMTNCTTGGVLFKPTTLGRAMLDDVTLEQDGYGFQANDGARATIANSVVAGNTGDGVLAAGAGASLFVNVARTMVANNGTNGAAQDNGVEATGSATLTLESADIFNNVGNGIASSGGATVATFGNNHNTGTGAGGSTGAPTQAVTGSQ